MGKKWAIRLVSVALAVVVGILLVCQFWPRKAVYYHMSVQEIDRDIRRISAQNLSTAERMTYYSSRFLGAPYELYCQGDGPHARYDPLPLLNLKKINCMTYCEIVMALTLADYYIDFFNILQHIRYENGIIGMATRNHYTMGDWLPANSWCLDDVTHLIGGADTRSVTRVISHETFFAGKGIDDIPIMYRDREVTIDYLPFDTLLQHEDDLQSGDVVALILDAPGIFSAHMLLVIKNDQGTVFRHASMSAGKTIDSPFAAYIADLRENPKYIGMSFMRMRDKIDWDQPGGRHGKFRPQIRPISRRHWEADPARDVGREHTIQFITLHHSGVEYYGEPEPKTAIRAIQRYHQVEKKRIDIDYHYLIDPDGLIYAGRPETWVGDTETDYDPTGHLLICVLGNFEIQKPNEKQLAALTALVADKCLTYGILPEQVRGHRQLTETLCPGKHLQEWIDNGLLIKRVQERLGWLE
ncbi:DUF1460 domain-containing protein [candidate division KSB1 bacterium]|nr:DUF1460 domain-containing protein [candidate division KSB1 bacterium]